MRNDDLPEYVRQNRAAWDDMAAGYFDAGRRNWGRAEPSWGIWGIPDADLGVLPADLAGKDTIELGCGTAYISAWLARRGARPVGIDNSEKQLESARTFQREFGLEFPLIHGNAEKVPLPDASFDLAISEYGASIWADPYRWIPEASRLLRPGGELIFLVNGTLLILTVPDQYDLPATDQLQRPYFGMHRLEWEGDTGVEFHLGYGDWIRLLRASDFTIEALVELRPPEGATTRYGDLATLEWARRWPSEEIWKARKRG
ncbi:MAG TPA: class I SAM-dependent methyltransferase [Candidatus Acidoferrum sp.]|nr:class I SAM-dependent methyltransferase [Candidatus Acidoferrum sp.]